MCVILVHSGWCFWMCEPTSNPLILTSLKSIEIYTWTSSNVLNLEKISTHVKWLLVPLSLSTGMHEIVCIPFYHVITSLRWQNLVSHKKWNVPEIIKTFIAVNTRVQIIMLVTSWSSKYDIFVNWQAKFCQYNLLAPKKKGNFHQKLRYKVLSSQRW